MMLDMRVGVIYGGQSVEHDVSILTALQAIEALTERHEPVPIYISRGGHWYTGTDLRDLDTYKGGGEPQGDGVTEVTLDLRSGSLIALDPDAGRGLLKRKAPDPVKLDCILPATHGTGGEDGALQGLLELSVLPYVGCDVPSAALAMDKTLTKAVLREHGLPTVEYVALQRAQWDSNREATRSAVLAELELPVYVKPASLGSSIGVSRCADNDALLAALELAFELDSRVIVERAVSDPFEVNCAVTGRPGAPSSASICEQPIAGAELLSFEDKYMSQGGGKGGGSKSEGAQGTKGAAGMASADRIIPAPISDRRTAEVQELARRAFEALGCAGVTRVDLLLEGGPDGAIFVNELNTVPGSFSFYLWEPAGVPFIDLLDRLLELAVAARKERDRTTRTFETALIELRSGGNKS